MPGPLPREMEVGWRLSASVIWHPVAEILSIAARPRGLLGTHLSILPSSLKQDQALPGPVPEDALPRGGQISQPQSSEDSDFDQSESPLLMLWWPQVTG